MSNVNGQLRKFGGSLVFISLCLVLIASELPAQGFDQNSYYRLVAKHSGMVLDVNLSFPLFSFLLKGQPECGHFLAVTNQ